MAERPGYEAGTAWLSVVPSFENIDAEIKRGLQKAVDEINKGLSDAMPDGVKASAKATAREAGKVGDLAAESFAGHFADTFQRQMSRALRAVGPVEITADSSDFDKRRAQVIKDMEELRKQRLGIDIDPATMVASAEGIGARLRSLRDAAGDTRMRVDLSQAADEVDQWVQVARAGGEKMAEEARRAAAEQARIHQAGLDENERRERKAIAERNRLHAHALEEDLRRTYLIRQEQGRIHQQAIDEDQRREWLAQQASRKLHEQAIRENALADVKARRERTRQHEQAIAEDHKRQREAVQRAARIAEQEFSRTVAGKIQAEIGRALQSLPDIGMRPARDAAEQLVKDMRVQLETLRGQRLGIDVDAGQALANIAAVQAALTRLANNNPDLDVRAEVIQAVARLTMVERIADRLDGRNLNIEVNADASSLNNIERATNTTLSRLEALTFMGLSLGTTLIPAAGAVAAAIGFIGTSAVAAASGIGVLALGFSGVGGAVKALDGYQKDAHKSALAIAAAQDRVASATGAVTSANQSLANTRANAAVAQRRAAQQVADAERAVGDARRQAAEQVRAAAGRLVDAQRDAARADQEARDAREDLTRAYRDARMAMADLNSQVKRNSLDQRQATLDLKDAREELNKTLANPRASEEEREQARITYERRVQQIDDLKRQGIDLARQQEEANRKGVAGSDQVVAARKRIADADQRAAEAQRRVTEARAAVVRAQVDGARRVADAQRRVADAQAAQVEQQRQSAFQIAQAQQGVISAQRQLRQAYEKTGVAGGEALEKLNEAMANLTPTGQRFAKFIFGLKDEFDALRGTAADNLLPGVQSAIENLLPRLPAFQNWVGRVAGSIGDMFEETSNFLQVDPTWRRFFGHVDTETVPTLERLYRIGRNTTTGLLGLYMAFTGFDGQVGGGLERLTERFARWSAELDQNRGFQEMLDYIRENGPDVVDLLGEILLFAARFLQAAAPIGDLLVALTDGVLSFVNAWPMPVLHGIVLTLSAISLAILAVNTATRLTALTTQTWSKLSGAFESVRGAAQSMADGVGGSMDRARGKNEEFSRSMNRARLAGLNMRGGLATVGSFLSGPWGVAVGGAAFAVGSLISLHAEHSQKVDTLRVALESLRRAYDEATNSGMASGRASEEAMRSIVQNNPDLQRAVVSLDGLGIGWEQLTRAVTGSEADFQSVLSVIDAEIKRIQDGMSAAREIVGGNQGEHKRIEQLKALRDALLQQSDAAKVATQANEIMNAQQGRSAELTKIFAAHAGPLSVDTYRKLAEQYDANADRIRVLKGLVDAFGNAQATAAQRANALRQAIELQTGAKVNAIEAEEAHARGLLGLTDTVKQNESSVRSRTKAGELSDAQIAKAARSLATNTEEGLRNRDALQAAAGSVRDRYLADIESGVPMEEATKRFRERLDALITNTKNMGFDEKQARELITVYGDIDPSVTTAYTTKGFDQVYKELQELQFAQFALSQGMTPTQAWQAWQDKQNEHRRQKARTGGHREFSGDGYGVPGFSIGGPVRGPGTSTSDSILARLSNREFVQPAASVDYYGQGLMEALRTRALPREILPGFAAGGSVSWPFRISTAMTRIPAMDEVRRAVISRMGAGQPSSGGIGSADMMRILRAVFPGLQLYSGYRPGSRTSSGNLSYHAMTAADGDKGRAVDLPPRRDVFDFIHDNYFRGTRELIWAGDPNRNIWNGRYHRYSDALLANHGVAGQPNAHLHWAYDQGGYLPPGVTTVYNGTGKPEPVFTDSQWGEISALVRNNHAEAREVHHWHFKEAALDHGRLQAWADARDARARPGRPM